MNILLLFVIQSAGPSQPEVEVQLRRVLLLLRLEVAVVRVRRRELLRPRQAPLGVPLVDQSIRASESRL